MRALLKTCALLVAISVCGVLLLELFHYLRYGHLAPLGLHADLIVARADYGIEGITKVYSVKLTNYSFHPVTVSACDFVDDAFHRGTEIAYAVEKWNAQSANWEPVAVLDQSSFCHPYPLGIIKAHLFSKRLWPGQSVSGGEEATAAGEAFKPGDSAHFVAFAGVAGNMQNAFPTIAFRIDEHRMVNGVPYRIKH